MVSEASRVHISDAYNRTDKIEDNVGGTHSDVELVTDHVTGWCVEAVVACIPAALA